MEEGKARLAPPPASWTAWLPVLLKASVSTLGQRDSLGHSLLMQKEKGSWACLSNIHLATSSPPPAPTAATEVPHPREQQKTVDRKGIPGLW